MKKKIPENNRGSEPALKILDSLLKDSGKKKINESTHLNNIKQNKNHLSQRYNLQQALTLLQLNQTEPY